jgi:hypothetical protein
MYCELLEHDMNVIEAALSRHREEISQQDFDRFFRSFSIREGLARLRDERRSS